MMLKEDCYWYYEERDMGARLPFCKLKKGCNPIAPEDCANCEKYHSRYTRIKADSIRSMSDEELAKIISDSIDCNVCQEQFSVLCDGASKTCEQAWLDWLKEGADG